MKSAASERECLACGALPGKPCLQPNGKISRAVHAARIRGTERSRAVGQPAFCAICTADIANPTPRQAPIGKGNALVNVCDECFDETPVAADSERPAYEVPPDEMAGSIRRAISEGAARAVPNYAEKSAAARQLIVTPYYVGVEPGYEPIRIPRICPTTGRRRDGKEAFELAVAEHGSSVKGVGTSARYFIYQKPSAATLAKARRQAGDHRDPIAAIAAHKKSTGAP